MGFAGVWHSFNPPEWSGDTGFYLNDFRPPPADDAGAITWSPIHVWAAEGFWLENMAVTFLFDEYFAPPTNREFFLELLYVPDGMAGAPTVGTRWEIPFDEQLTIHMPTYEAKEGHGGYQFAVTMSGVVPEPNALLLLITGCGIAAVRRR